MKMKSVVNLFVGISLIFITGCKTRSMEHIEAIQILDGLTEAQALDAVALASDPTIEKGKTLGPIKSYEDGHWAVLDRGTNFVIAAFSLDKRSVTVRYSVEGRTLVPKVEAGVHVRLSENRIHGNVLSWLSRHAADIKAAMWKVKSGENEKVLRP
jgi:hypothetical protein